MKKQIDFGDLQIGDVVYLPGAFRCGVLKKTQDEITLGFFNDSGIMFGSHKYRIFRSYPNQGEYDYIPGMKLDINYKFYKQLKDLK